MAENTESDNGVVHRLRNHIQIVGGLLRLHADHVEEAKALDLFRKLRTRLAVLEATSFLVIERPHQPAAVRPMVESIAIAVGRIYDEQNRHRCAIDGGDFRLDAVALAVAGQIFAEYLSTMHSRRSLRGVPTDIVAAIDFDAEGVVTLSVRDRNFVSGGRAEAVDPLTAKMVSALAGSIGGEAQFDGDAVFDARLTFKARVEPGVGDDPHPERPAG